jgi:signal transduction histidine kinase
VIPSQAPIPQALTEDAAFTARARIVDLLGREQIADAPTAVSELLKNAVDAYADEAVVHFTPAAQRLLVEDNGLGMRKTDLLGKWLVLATDAKHSAPDASWLTHATPAQRARLTAGNPPLGRKGIGRLATAHLGRGLLVWTRWGTGADAEGTLLLVHWGLFQLPRLALDRLRFPLRHYPHGDVPTTDHVLELMGELAVRVESLRSDPDVGEDTTVLEQIVADLSVDFRRGLDAPLAYRTAPGTQFLVLGTTPEVDELFKQEEHVGEDVEVSEGMRLLLGFCDPFTESAPRLHVRFLVNGEEPRAVREFWTPDDFTAADYVIDVAMDEQGFVTGRLRVREHTYEYQFQTRDLPARFRNPGRLRLYVGYVPGRERSWLTPDDHYAFDERLQAYGALYVYRDGIRVLPYGRVDQDFLEFEERRSKKAGRYFFSYRRMFGGVFLDSAENAGLQDKAGREGFIKNGAYRGLVRCLKDIFIDIATSYFSSGSTAAKARAEQENAEAARKRAAEHKQAFLDRLAERRARIVRHRSLLAGEFNLLQPRITRLEGALPQVSGEELDGILTAYRRVWEKVQGALDDLSVPQPASVILDEAEQAVAQAYQTDIDQLEQSWTRKLHALDAHIQRLLTAADAARKARQAVQTRIAEVRAEARTRITQAYEEFRAVGHRVLDEAEAWAQRQLSELDALLGEGLPVGDGSQRGEEAAMPPADTEAILAGYQRHLREIDLPFWSLARTHIEGLHDAESGEAAIGALSRELETLEERTRVLADLAQLGLIVEAVDHDYTVLFQHVRDDLDTLQALSQTGQGAEIVARLERSMTGLEAKLRLLSPLYRRKFSVKRDLSGQEIRAFLEGVYPLESLRDVTLEYSQRFTAMVMPAVNVPVVLAAAANLVSNSIYWVTKGSPPQRIRFSITPGGFVVSDSGPGVHPRDCERIFEPFFGRRPYGRGLGLYIARTNLRGGDLDLLLAEEPQRGALSGANFIIRKKEQS